MSRPLSDDPATASMGRSRRRALTYDDLPPEMKEAIQDYLRHTNASLRAAVKDYFEDKAATEREWGKIGTWDVGRVTDMLELFRGRTDFDEDLGAWDTSSVTTMKAMFATCYSYTGQGIGAWDTSSVKNMSLMFDGCHAFCADIGAWDTSVTKWK